MTALAAAAEPSSARLVGTLGLAGLLSGLLLVGAYEATRPQIERNRAAALRAAVFEVVPGATAMRPLAWDGTRLAAGDEAAADAAVYVGYAADGSLAGFAIANAGPGFQDSIALICGYDPRRRRLVGMRVLESRETPGLGDKIIKDLRFVAAFADLAVEPAVEVVKAGSARAHNRVDGITGATISSKAVVRIVNDACSRWLPRLPDAGSLPPPPRAAGGSGGGRGGAR